MVILQDSKSDSPIAKVSRAILNRATVINLDTMIAEIEQCDNCSGYTDRLRSWATNNVGRLARVFAKHGTVQGYRRHRADGLDAAVLAKANDVPDAVLEAAVSVLWDGDPCEACKSAQNEEVKKSNDRTKVVRDMRRKVAAVVMRGIATGTTKYPVEIAENDDIDAALNETASVFVGRVVHYTDDGFITAVDPDGATGEQPDTATIQQLVSLMALAVKSGPGRGEVIFSTFDD